MLNSTIGYAQAGYRYKPPVDDIPEVKDKLLMLQGKTGRTNDSLRLELLNSLSVSYLKKSKDTSLYYAQKALVEAKAIDLKNLIAVSLYNIARVYEYYKELDLAEVNYLAWMEVRKNQNDDEYRWALHQMRRYYIQYKNPDKLQKIQQEWMVVLDRQLANGQITPWYNYEDATPEESYKYSTLPTIDELIGSGNYFIAEESFLHMIEKCPTCSDWTSDEAPYDRGQYMMLNNGDTATLTVWYDHWNKAVVKYSPNPDYALEAFRSIAYNYVTGELKYDKYFDKYYPLMMTYTYDLGGDKAVYVLHNTSLSYTYGSKFIVKIKLNLFLIQSCLKVGDKDGLKSTYKELDRLISGYLSNRNSKEVLKKVLQGSKAQCADKGFVKWCDKHLNEL